MDIDIENRIIEEYKKGKSSIDIVKILKLSKRTILKILNKHNLIRKRDRCSKLEYEYDGKQYQLFRTCPTCGNSIVTKSVDKIIACRNHFDKINNNIDCKSCSLKKQVGQNNPFYGKKHTKTTKNKISKSRTGKATGKENSMNNLEHRKKATIKLKEKWDNGEMEHVRKIMSESMKSAIRSGKIKSFVKSKAENEIFNFIKNLGIDVKHSYRIDTKICDIYIPDINLIIEYNGDYWHCNPTKYDETYFHTKKSKTAKDIWEYDRVKLELIRDYGYNVEVVWESDYKNNKEIIKDIINKYDRKNSSAPERS